MNASWSANERRGNSISGPGWPMRAESFQLEPTDKIHVADVGLEGDRVQSGNDRLHKERTKPL